jgi:F-type H+-transporting ATPase subunit b
MAQTAQPKTIVSAEHVPSAEHGKGFPPFDQQTFASQLVWLAIAFVALYVLMSRFALPRVGAILAARSGTIAADLAEAQRLREQAEAAVADYEKLLGEARANAHALAAKTRDELMAKSDARRKVLEDELQRRLDEAEKAIVQTKNAAMANVRGIAAEATIAIVERLTGAAPSGEAATAAVESVLKR